MPAPLTTRHTVIDRANLWRDHYNPMRGLTIARAVDLLESYPRGEYADLMWTLGAPYVGIECADPDLLALIESRTSALLELDWNARETAPPEHSGDRFDAVLAREQAAYLYALVDHIDDLYGAIAHLAMATFRGYALCEIIPDPSADRTDPLAPDIASLRPVEPWHIVRDGSRGPWRYNPTARQTTYAALGADLDIDPAHWAIRTVARPIGRIAIVKYIRQNLCEKDWDAFIEIYGIPGGVVTMPPNVPQDREDDYATAATDVARGGSGALPHGATYTANDTPRGTEPFGARLRHLSEQLILAGTGGQLTMLTAPGSGTLAGGAHQETFNRLARAEARQISEILHRQIFAPRIRRAFPGQPIHAWFELAANEEVDATDYIDAVGKLATAGYRTAPAQIQEKTGYQVEPAPATPGQPDARYINRATPAPDTPDTPETPDTPDTPETPDTPDTPASAPASAGPPGQLLDTTIDAIARARAEDYADILPLIEAVENAPDPESYADAVTALDDAIAKKATTTDPTTSATARVIEDALAAATLTGAGRTLEQKS